MSSYTYFLPHSGIITSPFSIRNPHRKELYAALEAAWRFHCGKEEDKKGKLPHAGVRIQIDEHDRFELRVTKEHCAEDGSVRAIHVPSLLPSPERKELERLTRAAVAWESSDR